MTDTFVIKLGDEWIRISEDQIPSVEKSARQAFNSWRRVQSIVISTNIALGMSEELGLNLPGGLSREEVERGNEVLRDIYIRWGRETGELSERSERFLRGEMDEQEAHKFMGDTEYARELERINKAEEAGKSYKKMWR